MNQLFASGGQSIEASALATIIPMNIQDVRILNLKSVRDRGREKESET